MLHLLSTFAQYSSDYSYNYPASQETTTSTGPFPWGIFIGIWVVVLIVWIITAVAMWKLYKKAGKPGWAAIIPVYSTWVLFEIVGYPGWWAVLSIVPFVNIFPAIMSIIAMFKFVKMFGKSDVFAVLTILFPIIFLPVLAFGDATFQDGGPTPSGQQGFGGAAPGPQADGSVYPPYPGQPAAPVAPPTVSPTVDQSAPAAPEAGNPPAQQSVEPAVAPEPPVGVPEAPQTPETPQRPQSDENQQQPPAAPPVA